jgi:CRISPR-associated protein Cmr3
LLAGAIVSLVKEERIHVGMGPSGTADDGKLFATEGLRTAGVLFDHEKHSSRPEKEKHTDLEFLVDLQVEDRALGQLSAVLRPLGGERRLTSWTATSHQLPGIPDWLSKHVEQTEKPVVRVVLLTPAHIQESSGPRKLDKEGIATTIAARVDRPLTISGWDMAKGQPKKTRRLAASGSVFWVQLSGTAKDRLLWLKEIWMGNVSDDPQLARDGFGLAAVGIGSAP